MTSRIPSSGPVSLVRRLAHGVLISAFFAASASAVPWAPRDAAEPEREFHEVPAEKWTENLPESKVLLPAPAPRSVPAIGQTFDPAAAFAPAVVQTWTALGPNPIPNGQTEGRQDPVSGRVTAISIHPTNQDIVYVGTAQGGLYRTLNGGTSWTQLMDNAVAPTAATPLAIGAVTIDPTDPTRVFVGTGEGNLSADSFFGSGFYIITAADSATPTLNGPFNAASGLEAGVAANADVFTGRSIVGIAVDSTNPNNVFVSTSSGVGGLRPAAFSVLPRRGLYRSTNAASGSPTWTRLQVTGTTSTNTVSTSVVMEPGNPNNVVVSYFGQAPGDPAGVYRTTDALAPTPTFTQSLVLPNAINSKLAIQKATDNTVTVYATADQNMGTLYKSVNGGATFVNKPAANNYAGAQGFYDITVGVDPSNGNTVSVGGQAGNKIFRRSTNGGDTFTIDAAGVPVITKGLHADVHAITYAPSNGNCVYHGNDGGIWRSLDGGNNWTSLNNTTFSATQFSGIALHPSDRNFTLGGTQDNGTELLRPDGTFIRADFGDGGFSLIDQNPADTTTVTMYHTYFNARTSLIATARVLTVPCATEGMWALRGAFTGGVPTPSCDGSPGQMLNGIAITDNVNFYAPMVLGPGNPNTWYFGTDKLYRSPNRADTVTAVSQLLDQTTAGTPPLGTPVSTIAISPQDDNVRVTGLNNGKIFASTNGAPAMLQIAGPGATNGPTNTPAAAVGRILIDPNNKNVAYFAFGGFGTAGGPIPHVYKVSNLNVLSANPPGNVVFTPVSNGLPDLPANALAIDPQSGSATRDSSDIYVGTDNGVYKTNNGGGSWSLYATGLPHVAVFGLDIQNPNRLLRAATHGRGFYETGVTASAPAVPQLSNVVSRKTHGSAGTYDVNMPLAGAVGVEPRKGSASNDGPGSFTIVLRFTNDVTSGSASVTGGTGSVAANGVTFSGRDMIVNLTGVANAQTLTLTVSNVTDTSGATLASAAVNLGFLIGDITDDRSTNSGDATVVRNNSGTTTSGLNFRSDINTDGTVNSGDAFIVRAKSGTFIPQ